MTTGLTPGEPVAKLIRLGCGASVLGLTHASHHVEETQGATWEGLATTRTTCGLKERERKQAKITFYTPAGGQSLPAGVSYCIKYQMLHVILDRTVSDK